MSLIKCPNCGYQIGKEELTNRERQVIFLVSQGRPNKEISSMLGIEETTVKTHLTRAFQKMDCSNRTELAIKFIGNNSSEKSGGQVV